MILGYNPHLSYNVALCYYRLKEYTAALKHIGNTKKLYLLIFFYHQNFVQCYIFIYNICKENLQKFLMDRFFGSNAF